MFLGSTICKIMCVGIFCRCIKKDVHLISDPLSLYIALRINDAFPLRILECIYCWLSSPRGDWHPSTTKKSPFHRHEKNSFAPVQNWLLIFSEVWKHLIQLVWICCYVQYRCDHIWLHQIYLLCLQISALYFYKAIIQSYYCFCTFDITIHYLIIKKKIF